MKAFRAGRVLATFLIAVSVAGCAGSQQSAVTPAVPGAGGHGLTPMTLASGSGSPQPTSSPQASGSPQASAPGTYVHSTGSPAYPTALTSAPVYQDTQAGIISQTDPSTTYTNFYDSSGAFVRQVDIGQQSTTGMPIIRSSEANGTVSSMEMPDLNTQAASGSFTVGDLSYTLDGVGTAHATLAGKSVTVLVDDGSQTGTMTSPDGQSFALNLAPSASAAPMLAARLRKANGVQTGQHLRQTSASSDCVRARWLLGLAIAALILVIAGAAMICAGAANPLQVYYCYRALATIAGFIAAVAVATINMRKACASPSPSPTATGTSTPTPRGTATATATPVHTAAPQRLRTATATT